MTQHYGNHSANETDEQFRRREDEHTRRIAKDAAHQAVNETLQRLGIDDQDWHETQKDTAYLRKLRKNSDQISIWVARGVVSIVLTALAGAVWIAIKVSR